MSLKSLCLMGLMGLGIGLHAATSPAQASPFLPDSPSNPRIQCFRAPCEVNPDPWPPNCPQCIRQFKPERDDRIVFPSQTPAQINPAIILTPEKLRGGAFQQLNPQPLPPSNGTVIPL